jgi:hypothetical protein
MKEASELCDKLLTNVERVYTTANAFRSMRVINGIRLFFDETSPISTKALREDLTLVFMELMNECLATLMTDEKKEFMKDYLLLIDNWNDFFEMDEVVTATVRFIDRAIDNHFAMVDMMQVVKFLMDRMEYYKNYGLPSVEICRTYLRELDNKNVEKGCTS